jgi:hypothetical protein
VWWDAYRDRMMVSSARVREASLGRCGVGWDKWGCGGYRRGVNV